MMDTILNLGPERRRRSKALKARTQNGRFAYDSYRRFIQMFGNVVLEIPKAEFEHELEAVKHARGVTLDPDLDEAALRDVVDALQAGRQGQDQARLPAGSARAARGCRATPCSARGRTRAPRNTAASTRFPIDIGTAVNVQAMVFGNTGDRSGTGVGFTRNPATGREGVLRRVPDQRAGRGRRRRHPHAEADHRARDR